MSNCALEFKYVLVKCLLTDERVGEKAKVEYGVLFNMCLRRRVTICMWNCLFGCSLNDRLRVIISRYNDSLKKQKRSFQQTV